MPEYLQNLHTHSNFCDGRYTCEEMINRALELGFTSIGFSGHSYTSFDDICCMTIEGTAEYKKHIKELKRKYEGIIDVYCGIEFDLYSEDDPTDYEYVIGDCHYFNVGGKYIAADYATPKEFKAAIDTFFGGDGLRAAKEYYSAIATLPNLKKCDIAGHFDLIAKHSEKLDILNVDSAEYKNYALEAVTTVAEKIKIFEINVGCISRGYRSYPYPAPFILKRIKELGCGVTISSDCHHTRYLNTNFDLGIELARSCGFDEVMILTNDGFKGMKI